jgi:hypothetical protein
MSFSSSPALRLAAVDAGAGFPALSSSTPSLNAGSVGPSAGFPAPFKSSRIVLSSTPSASAIARLLKQQKKATRWDKKALGGQSKSGRGKAAKDADLSPKQAKTALRIANVPDDNFERQVESDDPPTVGQLAEQGTKKRPTQNEPAAVWAYRSARRRATVRPKRSHHAGMSLVAASQTRALTARPRRCARLWRPCR